jgi:hypothetical protein
MSSRLALPILVSALSLGSILVLASALRSENFEWSKIIFFASGEDKPSLKNLHGCLMAIQLLSKQFESIQTTYQISLSKVGTKKMIPKREMITPVTTDIDYVFTEIDSVRGGDLVKIKRKEIVETLKLLSDRVDAWLSS